MPRISLSACLLKVDDVAGDNHPMDSAELARISAAFVKAIAEAQTLADSGEFGAELQDLLRHARELLALALLRDGRNKRIAAIAGGGSNWRYRP